MYTILSQCHPHFFPKTAFTKLSKNQFDSAIGFRNILVHDYLDIDRKIVPEVLQQHLGNIEELKQVLPNSFEFTWR